MRRIAILIALSLSLGACGSIPPAAVTAVGVIAGQQAQALLKGLGDATQADLMRAEQAIGIAGADAAVAVARCNKMADAVLAKGLKGEATAKEVDDASVRCMSLRERYSPMTLIGRLAARVQRLKARRAETAEQ